MVAKIYLTIFDIFVEEKQLREFNLIRKMDFFGSQITNIFLEKSKIVLPMLKNNVMFFFWRKQFESHKIDPPAVHRDDPLSENVDAQL
jgi:hypothetical protein